MLSKYLLLIILGALFNASDQSGLISLNITQSYTQTELLHIDIPEAVEVDHGRNMLSGITDYLFVRNTLEQQQYQTVTVKGAVMLPGAYTIEKGGMLSLLIKRAGGYSEKAYLRGAVFTRENLRKLRQKRLDEIILRLEKEILAEGTSQVSDAFSKEAVEAKKLELQHNQKFITSLKALRATGRMTIKLDHLRLLKGSQNDIELEEGDSLYIPMERSVVNVDGAVMSRGSYNYSDKVDYKDYINMAGGYTEYADRGRGYVLKVDGTARKLSQGFIKWNNSKSRWELNAFSEEKEDIEPGDTIVVSEKLDHIAWLREIKDIKQILLEIALSTGVAIIDFREAREQRHSE